MLQSIINYRYIFQVGTNGRKFTLLKSNFWSAKLIPSQDDREANAREARARITRTPTAMAMVMKEQMVSSKMKGMNLKMIPMRRHQCNYNPNPCF